MIGTMTPNRASALADQLGTLLDLARLVSDAKGIEKLRAELAAVAEDGREMIADLERREGDLRRREAALVAAKKEHERVVALNAAAEARLRDASSKVDAAAEAAVTRTAALDARERAVGEAATKYAAAADRKDREAAEALAAKETSIAADRVALERRAAALATRESELDGREAALVEREADAKEIIDGAVALASRRRS